MMGGKSSNAKIWNTQYRIKEDSQQQHTDAEHQLGTKAHGGQNENSKYRIREQLMTLEQGGEIDEKIKCITQIGHVITAQRRAYIVQHDNNRYLLHALRACKTESPRPPLPMQAEKDKAQARLHKQRMQSERMASIGILTSGIAHDFNNILTPILGYAEIGADFCAGNETLQDFFAEINHAALRAKELIKQILIYARLPDGEASAIHLIPIIKEVAKQQTSILSPDIEVRTYFQTKEDRVLANPNQILQVITHLADNARDAMQAQGGTLDFLFSTFEEHGDQQHGFTNLSEGSYVRLSIKDTGTGIPDNLLNRVFEPFFSTKQAEDRPGMGLPVAKSILDAAGGAIAIESTQGEGTTIHIALPLLEREQEQPTNHRPHPSGNHQAILFVDDDPSICRMVHPLLTSIGYDPIICSDPQDALTHIKKADGTIHALISDLIMPGKNGLELAKAAHALILDLPIMIITGYPEKLDLQAAKAAGVGACLAKPVTRQDLSETLTAIIQGQNLLTKELEVQPAKHPPQCEKDA